VRRSVVAMTIVSVGGARLKRFPAVTFTIVLLNALVYFYTSYQNFLLESTREAVYSLGFIPALLFINPIQGVLRIFTSMFTHADILHILFNMYFLWLLGSRVENVLGRGNYLALYFASGLAAVLFHIAIIPVGGYDALVIPAVGASGAISGVLASYLLLFPRAKLVACWFFFILPYCFPVSTEFFLILWFAQQVIYGYLRLGGVAYFAHIGGFVAGIALTAKLAQPLVEKYRQSYAYRLLEFIERAFSIVFREPRGISGAGKAILALLMVAVAAGFAYSIYSLTTSPPQTYFLSVNANGSDDTVVLVIYRDKLEITVSGVDAVRILLNRLRSDLIYNPYHSGLNKTYNLEYSARVLGVAVPVKLDMAASYNDLGVLAYGRGIMQTRVVSVDIFGRIRVGEFIAILFEMSTTELKTTPLLLTSATLALLLTLTALYSLKNADELAMIAY